MPEMMLIKKGGMLMPAFEDDITAFRKVKQGQAFKVKFVRVSPRSLKHHQLYFGGLLKFTLQYWEPSFSYISPTESKLLDAWTNRIETLGNMKGTLKDPLEDFKQHVNDSRASQIELPNEPEKETLHQWVKEQAGYFDIEVTPTGIRKHLKSINFNTMDQDAFNTFYKAAFSVIWQFVLSRHFDTPEAAQDAVDQLSAMG